MDTTADPPPTTRAFISYSHLDDDTAKRVAAHLKTLGVMPMYDGDIRGGTPFREEIRWRIAYAHVFVCILTARSQHSSWVVSELGYAMGLGVPVLPLTFDELPPGLAQEIHAVGIKPDLSDLATRLTKTVIDDLIAHSRTVRHAGFEVVDHPRARTQFLVDEVARLHRFAREHFAVRQCAAFSSFSIPDASPTHADWDHRAAGRIQSKEERELLRAERQLLESHARQKGCALIIDPFVAIETAPDSTPARTARAVFTRLDILRKFLDSMSDENCVVAICRGGIGGNLTIMGNWLSAEAVVPHYKSDGYRQTTFARHAPTVLNLVDKFDRELTDALADSNVTRATSRVHAIDVISKIIATLPSAT